MSKKIFREFIEHEDYSYSSVARLYLPAYNNLMKHFETLDEIKRETMDSYFRIISKKVTSSTVSGQFKALKSFFKFLYEKKQFEDIFFNLDIEKYKNMAKKNKNKKEVSLKNEQNFYNFLNTDVITTSHLLIAFMLYMGLSKGELLNIKFENINFERRYLITGRNKNENTIKRIPQKMINILEKCKNIEAEGYLFGIKPSNGSKFDRLLKKITVNITGEEYTFGSIRNIFRKNIIKISQYDILTVSEILGEDVSVTMSFIEENDTLITDVINNLDKKCREILEKNYP